jgi:hypothetical protein
MAKPSRVDDEDDDNSESLNGDDTGNGA